MWTSIGESVVCVDAKQTRTSKVQKFLFYQNTFSPESWTVRIHHIQIRTHITRDTVYASSSSCPNPCLYRLRPPSIVQPVCCVYWISTLKIIYKLFEWRRGKNDFSSSHSTFSAVSFLMILSFLVRFAHFFFSSLSRFANICSYGGYIGSSGFLFLFNDEMTDAGSACISHISHFAFLPLIHTNVNPITLPLSPFSIRRHKN